MDSNFISWLSTTSERCVLVDVSANIGGQEKVMHFSNITYADGAIQYSPLLVGGVTSECSVSPYGDVSLSYGDVELDNSDGWLDGWLSSAFNGRGVSIYYGSASWPKSQFELVFSGVVTGVDARKSDRINIKIGDNLQRLNSAVVIPVVTDTSGVEKIVPIAFGEVFNVTPVLVDTSQLIYKVHTGPIEGIIEVRDSGVPVDFIPLKSAGGFQLKSTPVGELTASIQGDSVGGYTNKAASIVERLVTRFSSPLAGVGTSPFADGAVEAVDAAAPAPIGEYISDKANILETCQAILKSVGYVLTVGRDGKFEFVKFMPPANASPAYTVDEDVVAHFGVSPSKVTPAAPFVKVGWAKNWTVQSSGLASGIPAPHQDMYAKEWYTITKKDAAAISLHKYSLEPQVFETMLLVFSNADSLAEAMLERDKIPRKTFSVAGFSDLFKCWVGDVITLKYFRYGLENGVNGYIQKVSFDYLKGSSALEVFV